MNMGLSCVGNYVWDHLFRKSCLNISCHSYVLPNLKFYFLFLWLKFNLDYCFHFLSVMLLSTVSLFSWRRNNGPWTKTQKATNKISTQLFFFMRKVLKMNYVYDIYMMDMKLTLFASMSTILTDSVILCKWLNPETCYSHLYFL